MKTILLPLLLPLALACCTDRKDRGAPPTPAVQITTENALDVAKVALKAAFGLADVAGVGVGLLAARGDGVARVLDLKALVGRRVADLAAQSPAAPGAALPARITDTAPGPTGGQVIHSLDDRDGDEKLSTGDSCTSAFAAYAEGEQLLNGVLVVDEVTVSGDVEQGQSWVIRARMTFLNLSVTIGGATETLVGSLRLVRERRPTVDRLDLLLEGLAVGASVLQPGNTIGCNTYPLDYSTALFAAGSVDAEGIAGRVHYETVVPFTGLQFLSYPWAGVLEVRGGRNARMLVKMVDYTSDIEIEVDADGDGDVDETFAANWLTL